MLALNFCFVYLLYNSSGLLNISLRKSVANNVRVCQSIYNCLELTIDERLGPQNKIDILRLIQVGRLFSFCD